MEGGTERGTEKWKEETRGIKADKGRGISMIGNKQRKTGNKEREEKEEVKKGKDSKWCK